jgi:hypothetical protein
MSPLSFEMSKISFFQTPPKKATVSKKRSLEKDSTPLATFNFIKAKSEEKPTRRQRETTIHRVEASSDLSKLFAESLKLFEPTEEHIAVEDENIPDF